MNPNETENEKVIARQAAVFLGVALLFVLLLVLDLVNRGLVWRFLQSLRSENTSTLPDEQRTVGGDGYRTDVNFLT